MTRPLTQFLDDETATLRAGLQWAKALKTHPGILYLSGTLGAGKTALCRSILRGLGHQGLVKSPTYTLVESYHLSEITVHHFDLYRLGDPSELEFLGIRDYCTPNTLCLFEWPEKGQSYLPCADITIEMLPTHEGRTLNAQAGSAHGHAILSEYSK